MDRENACRILEVEEDANLDEIKKKYRTMIRMVHPDEKAFQKEKDYCLHSAQEINEAYAYLCEHPFLKGNGRKSKGKNASTMRRYSESKGTTTETQEETAYENWREKENSAAYRARKIFHEVRDEDGEKLGEICIAEGKYYWIEDEDFSMFLKSMFMLSKKILDEVDEEVGFSMEQTRRFLVQAELSYLLSSQFLDGEYSLKHLSDALEEGKDLIYHFDAMLETNEKRLTGSSLFPKRISGHKLYLQDEKGVEVGYLSFQDDRLYYVIIPLFEQRLVQVKIQLQKENKVSSLKRRKTQNYKDVDLWIRFLENNETQLQDSINSQIEKLLKQYRVQLMK